METKIGAAIMCTVVAFFIQRYVFKAEIVWSIAAALLALGVYLVL